MSISFLVIFITYCKVNFLGNSPVAFIAWIKFILFVVYSSSIISLIFDGGVSSILKFFKSVFFLCLKKSSIAAIFVRPSSMEYCILSINLLNLISCIAREPRPCEPPDWSDVKPRYSGGIFIVQSTWSLKYLISSMLFKAVPPCKVVTSVPEPSLIGIKISWVSESAEACLLIFPLSSRIWEVL